MFGLIYYSLSRVLTHHKRRNIYSKHLLHKALQEEHMIAAV